MRITKTLYEVKVIESDDFSGQNVDHIAYFTGKDAEKEANDYAESFNKHNTSTVTPQYYMKAFVKKLK